MKSLWLYLLVLLVVGEEYRSFVAKGNSDDLGQALGALQRRRRWLEAGFGPDSDSSRHQYGTVTHYPSARKKSLYPSSNLYDSIASIPPDERTWRENDEDEEDDDDERKMMMMKKSAFREREHLLEEERKKRRKKRTFARKRQDDEDSIEDRLRAMARRRFLMDTVLSPEGGGSVNKAEFLYDLNDEDIALLMDLLRKELPETLDRQHYMEGEGPEDKDRRKRIAIKKRLIWQDGFRQALGDSPPLKRGELITDGWATTSSEEQEPDTKWWSLADPKMLTALSKIEDGEYGRFDEPSSEEDNDEDNNVEYRKREADPWYPAYDLRKRGRNHLWSAYAPTSSLLKRLVPVKRKRSPFRERSTHDPGMPFYMGTSKRSAPIKRSPEEPVTVKKRMVSKKSTEPHVLNELKSILADEKDEKRQVVKRDQGEQLESLEEEDVDTATLPSMSDEDDELSEEQLNELMLDDEDDANEKMTKKRKRSWDDYLGMDKRSVAKRDGGNVSGDGKAKNDSHAEEEEEGSMHNLNQWMMNRYFKSMAAAMSSKKKRTVEEEDDDDDDNDMKKSEFQDEDGGSGHHPLSSMDRRLEAIENLMLEEALEMVEGRGAGNGGYDDEQRDKIVHRLDAAHSLEKMREALAEFEHSLDRIHDDEKQSVDEEKKKKKKAEPEKQNLVEALHVMAPQSSKRTSIAEELFEGDKVECPVFTEIAMLCTELSKAAGDSQRSLVEPCSRHVMCYACDYAYEDGPRIPCDLIFMREAHEICGDNLYCRSAAAQMHGVLRERAPAMRRSNANVCLSTACVKAYRRR